MRQIVETIQSEQNKIIRERKSPALFVDGIAGSGKTVVALHRIAYLMYHGIKNSLSAQNVLIVSPNDVFSDYISHVIPELGEEQVRTDTLMGILDTVCPCSYKTEHPSSLLEPSLLNLDHRPLRMDKLKQSEWMPTLLTKFVETYTNDHIEYSDVFYGDIRLATAKSIKNALTDTTRNRSIKLRMERQSEQIKSKTRQHVKALTKQLTFDILMAGDHPFDHRAVVRLERYKTFSNLSRTLSQMVSFTAIDVYRALLEDADYWTDHVGGTDHEVIRDLCQSTLQALDRGIVTRTDHVILAYISLLIGDSDEMTSIKHVVIDESQDYHATDYALFRRLYPKANFTILGDVHQSLNEEKDDSHHRRAQRMLGFDDALHMRLTTAYRNASGISDLCLGLFSDTAALGRIEREGKKPLLHHKRDENSIKNLIQTCFDEGHRTVAIITKTMERAQYLFQNELKSLDPHLIREDTLTLPDGLIVCPVYFAKGMEFDAVIIADADKEVYNSERDRQYLYIAASRALHELHLISGGSPTPLLDFYFK
nr:MULTISPECIES: UvrD-helicase domain-containing protein [unclassified Fusibacter]